MLAQLAPDERDLVPWHRVVPAGGDFGTPSARAMHRIEQLKLLVREGWRLEDARRLALSPDRLWEPDDTHRKTIWADEP
ncbi:MAG: hypothetical protein ING44_15705 [Telmatospirillum sp.]|nr:hypothetical protein [Telmatospirillum sp.]